MVSHLLKFSSLMRFCEIVCYHFIHWKYSIVSSPIWFYLLRNIILCLNVLFSLCYFIFHCFESILYSYYLDITLPSCHILVCSENSLTIKSVQWYHQHPPILLLCYFLYLYFVLCVYLLHLLSAYLCYHLYDCYSRYELHILHLCIILVFLCCLLSILTIISWYHLGSPSVLIISSDNLDLGFLLLCIGMI